MQARIKLFDVIPQYRSRLSARDLTWHCQEIFREWRPQAFYFYSKIPLEFLYATIISFATFPEDRRHKSCGFLQVAPEWNYHHVFRRNFTV